jgi:hypothetical protein
VFMIPAKTMSAQHREQLAKPCIPSLLKWPYR